MRLKKMWLYICRIPPVLQNGEADLAASLRLAVGSRAGSRVYGRRCCACGGDGVGACVWVQGSPGSPPHAHATRSSCGSVTAGFDFDALGCLVALGAVEHGCVVARAIEGVRYALLHLPTRARRHAVLVQGFEGMCILLTYFLTQQAPHTSSTTSTTPFVVCAERRTGLP
jgi:hypothetical protein